MTTIEEIIKVATVSAFLDEFNKIAAVPKAVKMYRRSLQGFEEAKRGIPKGDTMGVTSGGYALHGTSNLPGIVSSGMIHPSPEGERGQHGAGVYWWKGFPREGNLTSAESEGIAVPQSRLKDKLPMKRNIYSGHANPNATRTGPGDYKLDPKDTAIVDMAARSQDKTLGGVMGDIAERRLRAVDSSMFRKARQHALAMNAKKPLPPPTKQELVEGLKRSLKGEYH